ncbi:hypothetical protein [Mesorhizobium sp. YR577]|uniref:hypothetical protein n=1 Tax=Mesorhizobium sp. YR577 TaxID=1884373 RepID=UPI000B871EC7|nr:hypothetical protein [Mesorhizobium sp. YR577]
MRRQTDSCEKSFIKEFSHDRTDARRRTLKLYPNLEKAADQAIDACRGDARAAVIALLVANDFLEHELELARIAVSSGFSRGWHHRKAR